MMPLFVLLVSLTTPLFAIHGRFLHITDLHPDPFYAINATTQSFCHDRPVEAQHRNRRTTHLSGTYGAEISDCDSPWSLVNETFKTIEREWKDKIDFVIWTGDSARHDNDENFPRSPSQIADLNEQVAQMFYNVFKTDDPMKPLGVPIIPSLGNNDIFPRIDSFRKYIKYTDNVISAGPNPTTRRFARIWRPFYPESQVHEVEHGIYFATEVIPNQLAVISLNTIYWFDSNGAVDGCDSPEEPGFQQFEWLQNQLYQYRTRGVKVWLSGHIAPRKGSYSSSCWKKYDIWTKQFRDVIVGSVFGHSNVDFFIFLHEKETKKMKGGAEGWLKQIKKQFKSLAKKENTNDEHWAVANVVPSIIPNYYPSFRIWEYETKGLKHHNRGSEEPPSNTFSLTLQNSQYLKMNTAFDIVDEMAHIQEFLEVANSTLAALSETEIEALFNKKRSRIARRYIKPPNKDRPKGPTKGHSRGPAYDYQALTPIRYTQYYANLTEINQGDEFKFQPLYSTNEDPYYMKDLTVCSYIELARRIGADILDSEETEIGTKSNSLWQTFLERAFVGTNVHKNLDL